MFRKERSPLRSVGQVTAVTVGVIAYVGALLIGAFLIILASNMLFIGFKGTVPMDAMWCMFWMIQMLCGLMLVLVGCYPISQWLRTRRRLRWQKPGATNKEPVVKHGQGSNERHLVEDD